MNYSMTEADEQKAVIQWCILMEGRWPELEYIYHVPNGGSRNSREAANLKAQGVKPGVPEQKRWLRTLKKMGRCAVVCYEAEAAIKTIQEYLCLWQGERLRCDTGKEYPIIR